MLVKSTLRSRALKLARLSGIAVGLWLLLLFIGWAWLLRMPGDSFTGPLPFRSHIVKQYERAMRRHVAALSVDIGERHHERPAALAQAADYVHTHLSSGQTAPKRLPFLVDGFRFENIEATIVGKDNDEVVVVGAHYDSAYGTPAANDNGSGLAAMLVLAKVMRERPQPQRTIRFVGFANEEPPHFQTSSMGSLVYAQNCKKNGDNIVAMLSLETMGYFSDEAGSQQYPTPLNSFYPDTGNFIAFVSNTDSRTLLHQTLSSFRNHSQFPSEGAALPSAVPGVGWSDHWSFWQVGYPAVMVSDTAPFRYPHYHTAEDTLDKIDFERLARVVDGLINVIDDLANPTRSR